MDLTDPYRLILLASRMSRVDIAETTSMIAQTLAVTQLPVLIMSSAYAREEVQRTAPDLQVAGFVSKPTSLY